MALCRRCVKFDIQAFASAPYQTKSRSLESVKDAAEQEHCTFCSLLIQNLKAAIRRWEKTSHVCIYLRMSRDNEWGAWVSRRPQDRLFFNRLDVYVGSIYQLNSYISADGLELGGGITSFRVWADRESAAARNEDVIGIDLGRDLTDDIHIRALAKWFRDCMEEHPKCCETMSGLSRIDCMNAELPTRCIEIHADGIRLKNTLDMRGAYVTLSHRWLQNTKRSSTTLHNIEQRFDGIDEESLPKTFRHAIMVVRRLNEVEDINLHLWIDSLCIIQESDDTKEKPRRSKRRRSNGRKSRIDDPKDGDQQNIDSKADDDQKARDERKLAEKQDFLREAPKMGQYYQQSVFTIAAADASRSGFLPKKPQGEHEQAGSTKYENNPDIQLPYRDKDGREDGLFYVQAREYHADASMEYYAHVSRSELLKRAWVFQESMLSRRTVYYSQGRIFLECCTAGARNRFNEKVGSQDAVSNTLTNILYADSRKDVRESLLDKSKAKNANQIWCDLVEVYSGLEIGRPETDKVVAIMGIAKEIQHLLESEHGLSKDEVKLFAGYWLQDIHYGLLWEFKKVESVQPSGYEAPSWSWAAWSNAVRWRSSEAIFIKACRITASETKSLKSLDALNKTSITLTLQSKAAIVLLGPKLDDAQRGKSAEFSAVDSRHSHRWQAIARPDKPDRIVGWASLDTVSQSSADKSMPLLMAVHIATQRASEGLQYGYRGLTHDVYCVLFVEPVDNPKESPTPKRESSRNRTPISEDSPRSEETSRPEGSPSSEENPGLEINPSPTPNPRQRFKRCGVGRIFRKDFFKNGDDIEFDLI